MTAHPIPQVTIPASLLTLAGIPTTVDEIVRTGCRDVSKTTAAMAALAEMKTPEAISGIAELGLFQKGFGRAALILAVDLIQGGAEVDKNALYPNLSRIFLDLEGERGYDDILVARRAYLAVLSKDEDKIARDQLQHLRSNRGTLYYEITDALVKPGDDSFVFDLGRYAANVRNTRDSHMLPHAVGLLLRVGTSAAFDTLQIMCEQDRSRPQPVFEALQTYGDEALPALRQISQSDHAPLPLIALASTLSIDTDAARQAAQDISAQFKVRLNEMRAQIAERTFHDNQNYSFIWLISNLSTSDMPLAIEMLGSIKNERGEQPHKAQVELVAIGRGSEKYKDMAFGAIKPDTNGHGAYELLSKALDTDEVLEALPYAFKLGEGAARHIIDTVRRLSPKLGDMIYKDAKPEQEDTFDKAMMLRPLGERWHALALAALEHHPTTDNLNKLIKHRHGDKDIGSTLAVLIKIDQPQGMSAIVNLVRSHDGRGHLGTALAYLKSSRHSEAVEAISVICHVTDMNLEGLKILIEMKRETQDPDRAREISEQALRLVKAVASPSAMYKLPGHIKPSDRTELAAVFAGMDEVRLMPAAPEGHFVETFNAVVANIDARITQRKAFEALIKGQTPQ